MSSSIPTLHELLSRNPSPSVKDVLSTSDLLSAIRGESSELIDFLTPVSTSDQDLKAKSERISMLTTWALSDRNNNEILDYRICRNACNILSAPSPLLQKRIAYKGSPFVSMMKSFIDTKYAKKSEYAGHYQRIFETALRVSNGDFLKLINVCSAKENKIGDLFYIKIIKKANISGFNQLLILLASNNCYLNILTDGKIESFIKNMFKVLRAIVKKLDDNDEKEDKNIFWISSLFRAINEIYTNNPSLIVYFKKKKILKRLFSMIPRLRNKTIVIAANAFDLLKKITSSLDASYYKVFIDKYSPKLQFSPQLISNQDYIIENRKMLEFIFFAFDIFGEKLIYQLYPLFFMEPSINDHFCISFLNIIKQMNDETKMRFLTFDDNIILKKTIESIPSPPLNNDTIENTNYSSFNSKGNILALAQYIANPEENKVTTPFMETPIWIEFITKKLLVYKLLYQGLIPLKQN